MKNNIVSIAVLGKSIFFGVFLFVSVFVFPHHIFAAELEFSQNTITVAKGAQKTFNVVLKGDSSGGIIGTDLIFLYDHSKVKVVSVANLNVFTRVMDNSIENENGKTFYSIANLYTQPNPTIAPLGTVEIAQITIEGVETGSSLFQFDFSPGKTTDTNIAALGGNDVLTATKTIRININNSNGNNSETSSSSNSTSGDGVSETSEEVASGETENESSSDNQNDEEENQGEVAGDAIFNPERAKEYIQGILGVSESEKNPFLGINWKSPRVVAAVIIILIAVAVIIGFLVGMVYRKQS